MVGQVLAAMQLATSCACNPSTLINRTCDTDVTVEVLSEDPPQAVSAAAAISVSERRSSFMGSVAVIAMVQTISTACDESVTCSCVRRHRPLKAVASASL